MLNFKSFRAAKCVLAGIELMPMIRKGQFMLQGCKAAASCHLLTSFMSWQGKSAQSERLAFIITKITSISA